MSASPTPFPAPLEAFVELFNQEAFWASHEVLEGSWRETDSDFYHGLILYASAFVHVQRGNPHGIRAQLAKAERFLRRFSPAYLGVDVGSLLSHARACRKLTEEHPDAPADGWNEVIPFPRICLRTEHLRGDERELATDQAD
ncbi:MAG: DUF309 domain-containing protein [Gemmatimonadota bacterium]|jgi:hypothetical protein